MDFSFEKLKSKKIIGLDEAGRGPWAGPVVAASVYFINYEMKNYYYDIKDSKKLTPIKRQEIYNLIENDQNISFNYSIISNEKIDEMNILSATKLAMENSLNQHKEKAELILIDGNHTINYKKSPLESIIKGDDKVLSIATASIIAKFIRDKIMHQIHTEYPVYNFLKHKGYGTKEHRQALEKYGPCKYHRFSFKPIKNL